MNTDKLQEVIDILEKTNSEKFDMQYIINDGKMCIIGTVYNHFNPNVKIEFDDAVIFFDKYISREFGDFNKRSYIVSGAWAANEETNTIQNAIHRIQKVIAGYEPEDVYTEIEKELADINS